MITVAKSTPKDKEIAIGTIKKVAGFAVAIKGTRPIKVVIEVRKIGLKRIMPAWDTASTIPTPSSRSLLMVITSTKLAFTTTPESAIIPNTEKNTISAPMMK